jgi:voltage-gated potassium channel
LEPKKKNRSWRSLVHEVIYETDTPKGKLFDVILLLAILASVLLVMLESVASIYTKYSNIFETVEWIITLFFTAEYILRIVCVKKPLKYVLSFYGIIDLLSTLPKYISLFVPGAYALTTLRALRLLRVFRILKLGRYVGASNTLMVSLSKSRAKIAVFLFSVLILTIILGTLMYLIEGPEHGFTSIPKSIYWAIVTLTTVGYGDIAPATLLGQLIASLVMIMGYGIIAVPTGIIGAEISQNQHESHLNSEHCPTCMEDKHLENSNYCHKCGSRLNE